MTNRILSALPLIPQSVYVNHPPSTIHNPQSTIATQVAHHPRMLQPDYIFETSWEVCNKVGGIYAVLSTKARSMQQLCPDRVIFFGPDLKEQSDKFFTEDASVLKGWKDRCLVCRVGRWNVPGNPIAVLINYDNLWLQKNEIYGWAWQHFGVKSHAAYGDYDASSLFGFAAGMAMKSLYEWIQATGDRRQATGDRRQARTFVAHANEWQTAFAIFYLRKHCPKIGTLFTTHATGIGRSIAGNGKPLYDYFEGYHGDQMADELNMVSKHSVEKMAAHWADCFTTVSDITARECKQLLEKEPAVVTPNGFEPDFVPQGRAFAFARTRARKSLLEYAHACGVKEDKEALLVGIAGRQEWKNKGIDVFLDAMKRLGAGQPDTKHQTPDTKHLIAFVMIPYLEHEPMFLNGVTVFFVPYYLDGHDPIFKKTYYDLLIGLDFTIFPSYYEPWGYTPHESVAFHVPTVTTSLSGFGDWAAKPSTIHHPQSTTLRGVTVIGRNDSNYDEVVEQVVETVSRFLNATPKELAAAREEAAAIAQKGEWKHFFKAYLEAYDYALRARNRR